MSLAFIFWFLILCWVIFGVVGVVRPFPEGRVWYGHALFFLALFVLLGIRVFGWPIQG